MRDLGEISNADVIKSFVDLKGLSVVDVGCGDLTFTKILAELGAAVLGIDPDPIQSEKNRAAGAIPNIVFQQSGADQIPSDDGSANGVFFSYSLHHVPEQIYPAVFGEVCRVLKPGGVLYVVEPIGGEANDVMKIFHDEDHERRLAWQALETLAKPCFRSVETVTYHGIVQYSSWHEYADRYAGKSFNSLYTAEDVRRPEVEEAFQRLGGPDHIFKSPKNVMFLKGIRK